MTNQVTEVRLLNVPLENDYKHTLYFANREGQTSYFYPKALFSSSERSFQRKNSHIDWNEHIDTLDAVNYVMFRNSSTGKWIYSFVTDKEYKNDSLTRLYIETDVIQTYMFDYTVKPSFIEREHTNNDTIGAHTVPENLECGEFVCENSDVVTELADTSYVMGITEEGTQTGEGIYEDYEWSPVVGKTYDGIFSGVHYRSYNKSQVARLTQTIEAFAKEGHSDAIKCLFMYPTGLIENEPQKQAILGSETPSEIKKQFLKSSYKSYVPKNNKLLCFPYHYLLVANNNGGSAVYHFEEFKNGIYSFSIKGCITPGGSIRLIPENYKGMEKNHEEGLNLGKYPICNWSSDEYTNWLTQNSVNIGLNMAAGVGQVIAGGALAIGTAGVGVAVGGSQIAGGISTIAGQLAQIHQMSFTSPQSRGNLNCGDVVTADASNTFFFYQMRIKDEYMKIIDDYFSMFGYKCNRVKSPLKNHRENYWYTKTIDASIDGAINNKDLQTIKNCYNNGITFWKDPSKIGDYSVSNEIV